MKNSTLSLAETIHGSDSNTHQINCNSAGTETRSSPVRNIVLLVIYLAALVYLLDYFA